MMSNHGEVVFKALLAAKGWTHVTWIAARCGLPLDVTLVALDQLAADGRVIRDVSDAGSVLWTTPSHRR